MRERFLIVGLGNPGYEYADTRHNVGFMVVDRLASEHGVALCETSHSARWGRAKLGGRELVLAKPVTFMNLSGRAVSKLITVLGIDAEHLIVVHDDIDLEPGRIRVRQGGGTGGHRGLSSIIQEIGTDRFLRVKAGVGRPPGSREAADYVLEPFPDMDHEDLEVMLGRAADAVIALVEHGVDYATQMYNKPI